MSGKPLYDEVHELRPRPGRRNETIMIVWARDGWARTTCIFEGTWASGWDYPREYEFVQNEAA